MGARRAADLTARAREHYRAVGYREGEASALQQSGRLAAASGDDAAARRALVRPDLVPGLPTPTTGIGLQALRGAAARVAPDATAFLHRSPRHDLLVLAQWPDPADDERVVGWTRTAYEALRPNLDVAVYVNNLGVEGRDQVRAAFGANHDRLVALKRRLDPGNVFRLNQNVAP